MSNNTPTQAFEFVWTEEEAAIHAEFDAITNRDYTRHIGEAILDVADAPRWVLNQILFVEDGPDAGMIDIQVTDVYAEDNLDASKQFAGDGAGLVFDQVRTWHPELNPSRFISTTGGQLATDEDIAATKAKREASKTATKVATSTAD